MVTIEFIPSPQVELRLEMQRMKLLIGRSHGIHLGIFLVQRRGNKKLFVEKRVAFNDAANANTYGAWLAYLNTTCTHKVTIHRALRHANIVAYVDSFLDWASLRAAVLFMDFYPLGSLRNLAHRHQTGYKRRLLKRAGGSDAKQQPQPQQQQQQLLLLPEVFLWHVLLALMRALTPQATPPSTPAALCALCATGARCCTAPSPGRTSCCADRTMALLLQPPLTLLPPQPQPPPGGGTPPCTPKWH
jgi:hypothetical protein